MTPNAQKTRNSVISNHIVGARSQFEFKTFSLIKFRDKLAYKEEQENIKDGHLSSISQ